MIEQEALIREYYSKEINLNGQELARMMLLDGGFILYLLLKSETESDLQPIIGRVSIGYLVMFDLLLLENQIPFFVIRDLYNILVPHGSGFNLVHYALKYFSILDPCRIKGQYSSFCIPEDDVLHLLHLVYLSVLPCPQYYNKPSTSSVQEWIPSATKLEDFGVKFKKRKNESQGRFLSFLDIKFNDACGVMEIPQLRLHDYSVSLFRNLVAFEHCHPNTNFYITAYVAFMNCLVDEEEDRKSLHDG